MSVLCRRPLTQRRIRRHSCTHGTSHPRVALPLPLRHPNPPHSPSCAASLSICCRPTCRALLSTQRTDDGFREAWGMQISGHRAYSIVSSRRRDARVTWWKGVNSGQMTSRSMWPALVTFVHGQEARRCRPSAHRKRTFEAWFRPGGGYPLLLRDQKYKIRVCPAVRPRAPPRLA